MIGGVMNNQVKRFSNDEELFAFLESSGLGERLRKGEKDAFKEYFELNGAKVESIIDRQPTNN